MGSYSTLKYGHFMMGEFKSHVPLEPLLMFTREDFKEIPSNDPEYGYTRRLFRTTGNTAKHRMDSRGFTIGTCKALFDEFKSAGFWTFPSSGDRWHPNTVTFEKFLSACKHVYKKYESWYLVGADKKPGKLIKRIFEEGFFDDATSPYFDDVHYCILMRGFLEVADPDCEVVLEVTELIEGEYLDIDNATLLYDHYVDMTLRRIGIDYQLYGFLVENDPNVEARLRAKIDSLSEDLFIKHVLLPLLDRMGFQSVRMVTFHGRNEFGSDIPPFRYVNPLGTFEYYAVQAKVVPIHGTSGMTGNAGELLSQANAALAVSFVDEIDNERKKLDKFIIATSKTIKPDARRVIEEGVTGVRRIVFLDIDKIVALVKRHRLLQYLLFTELD